MSSFKPYCLHLILFTGLICECVIFCRSAMLEGIKNLTSCLCVSMVNIYSFNQALYVKYFSWNLKICYQGFVYIKPFHFQHKHYTRFNTLVYGYNDIDLSAVADFLSCGRSIIEWNSQFVINFIGYPINGVHPVDLRWVCERIQCDLIKVNSPKRISGLLIKSFGMSNET